MRRLKKIALMIATVGIIIGIGILMPKEVKADPVPPLSHDASYYNLGLLNNNSTAEPIVWLKTYGTGYFTSTDGVKYQFTVAEGFAAKLDGTLDNSHVPADMPSNPFLIILAYGNIPGGVLFSAYTEDSRSLCALDDGIAPLEAIVQGIYGLSSEYVDRQIAGERAAGAGLLGLRRCTSATAEDEEIKYIDYDTFKSEFASGTATASIPGNKSQFFDLKGHAMSKNDAANQMLLAQAFAKGLGKNEKEVTAYGVFPRRDLSTSENGGKYVLTWKNIPGKVSGTIYAVCYNQTDGSYVLTGTVDATGKAVFPDFKLRPATNVTLFTLQ